MELPDLRPGDILTETLYTCISPGTDLRVLSGVAEAVGRFPFVIGYSNIGRIISRGTGVDLPEGTLVFTRGVRSGPGVNFLWGSQTAHCVLSASDAIQIPEGVDIAEACLTKLAAICYHGVRQSRPFLGEKAVVIGLGIIGQISARLHQSGGAKVIALDRSKHRVAIAKSVGIDARKVDSSLADACYDILPGGADIVVEATGVPSVLKEAVQLASSTSWSEASCSDARILIQGSYPDDVCFNYSHANGKQARFLLSRDTHLIDYLRVTELLKNKMLKMRDLISDIRLPADAQKTFDELRKPETKLMTVVFDWQRFSAGKRL